METITWHNFAQVELRVGTILEAAEFPEARKPAFKVRVDFGDFGVKWSSAQITSYEPEALVGSLVVCVCNFAPKNIAGFTSEVLILGAKNADGKVIVLSPRSEVAAGEIVY